LGISLSIFVSLSILVVISFSPPTPFSTVVCYPFTSLILSFSISSILALLLAKDGICDANGHGNNNAMNPPPLD
jgi:hypothetical protein